MSKTKPLCKGAWAIPPSPLMLTHGNNYYTCSKCSEPYQPPTTTPPQPIKDTEQVELLAEISRINTLEGKPIGLTAGYDVLQIINQQVFNALEEAKKYSGTVWQPTDGDLNGKHQTIQAVPVSVITELQERYK